MSDLSYGEEDVIESDRIDMQDRPSVEGRRLFDSPRRQGRWVMICACGHDEFSHGRKIGPYLLCSSPGCKCADRNYVNSEFRARAER
jgi:hypothetical protein